MKHNSDKRLISAQQGKPDDRRIRRTRQALASALLALATQGPYEQITIRDITDKADVGYATFFRHYEGKDALMLDIFQNLALDLETIAGQHDANYFEKEGLLIFTQVRANESLYRGILDSLVFTRKLKRLFSKHIESHVQQHMPGLPNPLLPPEVAVNHMVTSLISLIEWWIDSNFQLPEEQMAQIYDRLVIQATWHVLSNAKPLGWA